MCVSHSVMSDSWQQSMDCSPPGSSVHGILQARILEWVAIPFSRGSSQPRDWTWVSCIVGRFLTTRGTRETPSLPKSLVLFKWQCAVELQGTVSLLASLNHRDPILLCILGIRAGLDELGDLWGSSRQDVPVWVNTEPREEKEPCPHSSLPALDNVERGGDAWGSESLRPLDYKPKDREQWPVAGKMG